MRVFSKEKFMKDLLDEWGMPFYNFKWVNECDGQEVIDGEVIGKDGWKYQSHSGWEIEV